MTETIDTLARDLVLVRTFHAPAAKIYEAWTNPDILKKWFAPLPFTTPEATLDLRVGGENSIVMQDADGNRYPNVGIYLELVPNRRIVFTDAFTAGWTPSAKPFFVGEIRLEEHDAPPPTPPPPATGPSKTSRRMRTWAFTRAGANAPTSSPPCWRSDREPESG